MHQPQTKRTAGPRQTVAGQQGGGQYWMAVSKDQRRHGWQGEGAPLKMHSNKEGPINYRLKWKMADAHWTKPIFFPWCQLSFFTV